MRGRCLPRGGWRGMIGRTHLAGPMMNRSLCTLALCCLCLCQLVPCAAQQQEEPALAPAGDTLSASAAASQQAPDRAVNLLPNGNFEEGEDSPSHWQQVDGLTTFWVRDEDPARGKVLKLDTDVLQSQAYAWWKEILAGAKPADAPLKLPTQEPKYDTLAGLDGVWYYSDYIPIEPGKLYWLTIDAKGPPLKVWLLGYPEKPDHTFGADQGAWREYLETSSSRAGPQQRGHEIFIHKYIWKGRLDTAGSDDWQTFSRRAKPFAPTKHTPKVRFVRVLIYPYWPPATYYVDNVTLTEYQPADENH